MRKACTNAVNGLHLWEAQRSREVSFLLYILAPTCRKTLVHLENGTYIVPDIGSHNTQYSGTNTQCICQSVTYADKIVGCTYIARVIFIDHEHRESTSGREEVEFL